MKNDIHQHSEQDPLSPVVVMREGLKLYQMSAELCNAIIKSDMYARKTYHHETDQLVCVGE